MKMKNENPTVEFPSRSKIENLLKSGTEADKKKFTAYCVKLKSSPKNTFIQKKTAEQLSEIYERVAATGLFIDGEHVILTGNGVMFDYQSYKKRMFKVYPETQIDVQLVFDGDEFSIQKESGVVKYSHKIANAFQTGKDKIIGAYCIIKNKRGEFFTALSPDDIDKRRRAFRKDGSNVWNTWFNEMCLKTVVKRACSFHFNDDFHDIETIDNENFNLDSVVEYDNSAKMEELMNEVLQVLEHHPDAKKVREKIINDKKSGLVDVQYLDTLLESLIAES